MLSNHTLSDGEVSHLPPEQGTSEQHSSLNSLVSNSLLDDDSTSHLSVVRGTQEMSPVDDIPKTLPAENGIILPAKTLLATLPESGKDSVQQFSAGTSSKKQLDRSPPAHPTPQPLVTSFNSDIELTPQSPTSNGISFKAIPSVLNEPHIPPNLHESSVGIPPQNVLTKEMSACDSALNSVSMHGNPPPFSDHILQHSSLVSVRGSEDHNQQALSRSSPTHLLAHSPTVQRPVTQPFDTESSEGQNQRTSHISFSSHTSSPVSLKTQSPSGHLESDPEETSLNFVASRQPMISTPPPVELTPPLPPDPSDGSAAQSMIQQLLGDQNQTGSSPETASSNHNDLSVDDAAIQQPGSYSSHAAPTLVWHGIYIGICGGMVGGLQCTAKVHA